MSKKEEKKAPELEILHTLYGDYETVLTEKYKNRIQWSPKNEKLIRSFIPGTVVSINVEVGRAVEVGDTLLTFNAMKMLNTYKSPVAGTVKKIHVSVGEVIPKGVLLIEFK